MASKTKTTATKPRTDLARSDDIGLIRAFAPGSIQAPSDMTLALLLVLNDLFRDVGSSTGSSDEEVTFMVDDAAIELEIRVRDCREAYEERQATLKDAAGWYWPIIQHADKLGTEEAWRRITSKPSELSEDEAAVLAVCREYTLSLKDIVRRLSAPDPVVAPANGQPEPAKPRSRKPALSRKR